MKPPPHAIDAVCLSADLEGPRGLDLERLRGGRPLELEIGCGKGRFLVEAARREPDTLFVGVEVSLKYARKTAERIAGAGLGNARVVRTDGAWLLERVMAPASLRALHVYFPDPWPKRRHWKRRLFTPRFAAAAGRALVPGGSVFVLTDDEAIFAAACRTLNAAGALVPQPFDLADPRRPRTSYECKYLREQRTIRGGRWARRGPRAYVGRRSQAPYVSP